eukprot:scaffold375689_cov48-Prasinocladus_malaysianus.AAC.2
MVHQGLLIRGGDVLETASKIDTIVFDKTGTLTAGRPAIVDVVMNETAGSREQILSAIASVEQNTPHPIARALVAHAESLGLKPAAVEGGSFVQEPGSGASALVEGKEIVVGNLGWLASKGIQVPESVHDPQLAEMHRYGTT